MKDALGNDLRQGDLVALQLERPLIFGRIEKIEEGGIISGIISGINKRGESELRPGHVVIQSRHVLAIDPRMPVAAVLALRDEQRPQLLAESESTPEPPLTN